MSVAVTLAVYQLIEATWPTVQKVLSEEDADRINWLKAIQSFRNTGSGLLRTPFCVVAWGNKIQSMNGGICNEEYEWPVGIALVTDLGGTSQTEAYVMANMEAMSAALFSATMGANGFQLDKRPSIDYNPRSMANENILRANMPFKAAELNAVLRLGTAAA